MFQYFKSGCKEDGDSLFTRSHMEKTRSKGYKLLLRTFRLDTRGKFFTMTTISHWNNLPREVVDSPTLDTFKILLDRTQNVYIRPIYVGFIQEKNNYENAEPCQQPDFLRLSPTYHRQRGRKEHLAQGAIHNSRLSRIPPPPGNTARERRQKTDKKRFRGSEGSHLLPESSHQWENTEGLNRLEYHRKKCQAFKHFASPDDREGSFHTGLLECTTAPIRLTCPNILREESQTQREARSRMKPGTLRSTAVGQHRIKGGQQGTIYKEKNPAAPNGILQSITGNGKRFRSFNLKALHDYYTPSSPAALLQQEALPIALNKTREICLQVLSSVLRKMDKKRTENTEKAKQTAVQVAGLKPKQSQLPPLSALPHHEWLLHQWRRAETRGGEGSRKEQGWARCHGLPPHHRGARHHSKV
ncbi:hypothetical protein QYF61_003110 [Mycteria americana]|uniref:Uncharacterized protein n=1 Tax=Mycteria americana TaxID=33587 RepID=A0AAN7RNL5_MYCAM|nr:hypothetical protein QYF61_003110 [Mycteria americana]